MTCSGIVDNGTRSRLLHCGDVPDYHLGPRISRVVQKKDQMA